MAPPVLEARGITKRFGAQVALEGVTLSVSAGEVHAIAGENGAGKSTLLAVLSGALRPDAGEVHWNGRPAPLGQVRALQELGLAIVHQEPQLVPALSVTENIGLGRLPGRFPPLVDWRAAREQAVRALAPLEVDIRPDDRVGALPLGRRQLVAIARALHGGARLILLDEPTSSLSSEETEQLFAVLRRLQAGGTALVYISHRLEEQRALADRLTVLRDGRVALTAPLADLGNDQILEAMSGRKGAAVADAERAPAGPGEVLLEVRGLGRRGDVALTVRSGEIVGLAGLMGAGRSRLLRSIFRAEAPGRGDVRLEGRSLTTLSGAIQAGLGLVPEDRRAQGLVATASVLENIGLARPPGAVRFGFLRWGFLRAGASRAVEALRIRTPDLDTRVGVLSGGNQQKVLLGRWLGASRRVLLLDEPTRGVDVATKAEIHAHLRRLAAQGLGLLVASSELPELLALSDRVYVMREGGIAGELARERARPAEILRLATGAR